LLHPIKKTFLLSDIISRLNKSTMEFLSTNIPDVIIIQPKVFEDERGFFLETYQSKIFSKNLINFSFVQENHSGSVQNTLRGLHYQIKNTQAKLVRAIYGEVFDVAVDLRRSSSTFGKWVGVTLSADNKQQLFIPKGFAHGFLVLSEWAEIIYKVDDYYSPEWERTIIWNDPQINIEWQQSGNQIEPILSTKDQNGKMFTEAELFE
jgi:dTDP-4-dehydrorhamnose 3,5-epimerase